LPELAKTKFQVFQGFKKRVFKACKLPQQGVPCGTPENAKFGATRVLKSHCRNAKYDVFPYCKHAVILGTTGMLVVKFIGPLL